MSSGSVSLIFVIMVYSFSECLPVHKHDVDRSGRFLGNEELGPS